MTLKGDTIFKEKRTGNLKNDIRNLVHFHGSSWKSENVLFDFLFLSIAYKVLQESYLSWYWGVIQTLNENWLFVWRLSRRIWRILKRVVENLRICTLMGNFCRMYVMYELKKIQKSCVVKNELWFQKWYKKFSHK